MKTKKQFAAFFLALVMVVSTLIPNSMVFAADIESCSEEVDDFYYTLDFELSEDELTETVTLTLDPKENITIHEIILPDGESVTYSEQPVAYILTENGTGNFTVRYIKSEVDTPVASDSNAEFITEEDIETELQGEMTDSEIMETAISFEITDILQAENMIGTLAMENTTVTTLDELNTAIANAADGDTITVDGNIAGVAVINGKKIILTGGTLQALNISNGSEVTLQDITIDANKLGNNDANLPGGYNDGGAAIVLLDSILNLNGGTVVRNAQNKFYGFGSPVGENYGYGGGISVIRSTLNMYDGALIKDNIADNKEVSAFIGGGGVFLVESIFNMYGGTIESNFCTGRNGSTGPNNGGGVDVYYSSMNMFDGEIINNTANYGGGIALEAGEIKIHGGEISNNTAYWGGGAIASSNADPTYPSMESSLLIDGNTIIQNNIAESFMGGGILFIFEITLSDNVKIINNSAKRGAGGVYCEPSTTFRGSLNLDGNVIINDNTVNSIPNNIEVLNRYLANGTEAKELYTISLSEDFNGAVGITKAFETPVVNGKTVDVVLNKGGQPTENMTESKMGANANFFSDNSNYITRIEKDGDNNKVVLGFPIVTYDLRGGSFTDATEETFYTATHQPITKPADPTFAGHTFNGWYTTTDGSTTWTPFDFDNTPIGKDTDIYARWLPEVYTISFDPNGGSGAMDEIYYDFNGDADLPANTFTKAGYTFSGWNTQADGNGIALADQQQDYAPGNQNVTLYAQWELEKYQVSFDPTPGTIGGSADVVTLEYSAGSAIASADLPADPVSDDYNFLGWYLDMDDEATKLDAANLPTVNGDMTYYAKWQWKPEKDPSNPQLSGLDITVDNTIVPFVFDPDIYKYDVVLASISNNMKVKPTAENPDATFTVSLRSNGRPAQEISGPDADGNYIISHDKFIPDDVYYVDITVFSADGTQSVTYTVAFFIGNVLHLVTDKDGTGAPPATIAAGGLSEAYPLDKTALGNPIVGVDENGAPKTINTQTDDFIEVQLRADDIPVLEPAVKTMFETAKAADQVIADYLEFTLHVVVKDKNATIKGNVLIQPIAGKYITIQAEIPPESRDGSNYQVYRLHDGTVEVLETQYDSVRNTVTFKTDKFSPYALAYTPKSVTPPTPDPTYTVTYNANGGTGSLIDANSPYTQGSTVTVLANTFINGSRTFTGWNTQADGKGIGYVAGNSFAMPATNVVLYAQWNTPTPPTPSDPTYTVTYNANGGTGNLVDPSSPYTQGSTVTVLKNIFTNGSKEFIGWNTQADGKGTGYVAGNSFTMPARNVVLYAQWRTTGGSGNNGGSSNPTTPTPPTPTPPTEPVSPTPTPAEPVLPVTPTPIKELDDLPKTSDNSNTSLWLILMGLSLTGLLGTIRMGRKRNFHKK